MKALAKILKFVSRCVIGLFGLALLLYLVAVGINWRDASPSAAVREFESVIAIRPPVADADNGFVYMLGFPVPADQDPDAIGVRRLRWLETFGPATDAQRDDPLQSSPDFTGKGSAGLRLRDVCQEDDRAACAREFDAIAADWQPTALDALALRRYETLLTRNGWRELVPLDLRAPLPAFAPVMHAQRLTFLRLAQDAARMDSANIRRVLSADFTFWKRTQRAADSLISKMIAAAALRQHFFYSALVMRRLPAAQVASAIPAEWTQELSADDRSMKRVLAGELMFAANLLRHFKQGESPPFDDWFADYWQQNFMGRAGMTVSRPLFQLQDQTNYIAGRYLELAQRFEVPMSEYVAVATAIRGESVPREFPSRVYNITGDLLLTLNDLEFDPDYALRVASLEGMRRAALLTAELHIKAVPPSRVAEELASAALRDPYDHKPFTWDAEHQAVVFDGPEKHTWHRVDFFY
jgi:hypothetical protein